MIADADIQKLVSCAETMSFQEMASIEDAVWQVTRRIRDAKIAAHPMGISAMAQALDGESQPSDSCFATWAAAHAEEHAVRDAVRRAFFSRREKLSRAADAAFRDKNAI